MIQITNRILEKSTPFTFAQVKRWAVAFLPADNASGQHSGVPRTYTFEDAVIISLGGYLVEDWRFTISEAQQILKDVAKWIKSKGWKISDWVEFRELKSSGKCIAHIDFPWRNLIIDIGLGSDDQFFYNAKIVHQKKFIVEEKLWMEKYEEEFFEMMEPESMVPYRSFIVKNLVESLADNIAQNVSE